MLIIGEKLNGFIPSVSRAIAAKDWEKLRALARRQTEAGAEYLDVCASANENAEEEKQTLLHLISLVRETVDTPICADSSNPKNILAALPLCGERGLVNSVSGDDKRMISLFSALAEKKGWGFVALLCDEKGVPQTAEGRLKVFQKIASCAASYGIAPERLYFDPIVNTLSTNENALLTFAECTRAIKQEDPRYHVTCGASNVSFGLPAKQFITRAFVLLAMGAGMDSAILDPCDVELCGLIHAASALLGQDEYCMDYISAYRAGHFSPAERV